MLTWLKANYRYLFIFIIFLIIYMISTWFLLGLEFESSSYILVNRILVIDNTPYLRVTPLMSWGEGSSTSSRDLYYVSHDYGKNWEGLTTRPATMPPRILNPENANFSICVPNNSQICFRITGKEQIGISDNGGKSWKVDWQMPVGRTRFINRNHKIKQLAGVKADPVPYDLGIVEDGDKYYVIAAAGIQGVMVRTPEGIWERYSVQTESGYAAAPLPYRATNINEINQYIRWEIFVSLFAAVMYSILFSIKKWRNIEGKRDNSRRAILWPPYIPFIISMVVFFGCKILSFAYWSIPELSNDFLDHVTGQFLFPFPSITWMIPITGLIISWLSILAISTNRKLILSALFASFGLPIIVIAGTWLSFALWAIGLIPIYEVSLIITCILNILIVYFGFRKQNIVVYAAT